DLSKVQMKEILRDQIFRSGSYKSHPDHSSLYQALEKTSDIREAPIQKSSSSSKQKQASPSVLPVDDIPILDDMHILDSKDTDAAHLLNVKTKPNWLKPVPEEERLDIPEPDWTIPPNDLSKPKNNDRNNQKKMTRETEVYKFSDGTLQRILDKMDFMVKDYRLYKFNPGMEIRRETDDDKRRSEDFIKLIKHQLKFRRIFRNLESFVSGRLRDIDYRLIQRTK
nr:hypothetical protein [Tanacetum cinerariifolium]